MEQERDERIGEKNAEELPSAYSDAYFRSAPEDRRSCYGYSPAECYARASGQEEKAPVRRKKHHATGLVAVLICMVVILAGAVFFSGGMILNTHANADVEAEPAPAEIYEEYSASVANAESEQPVQQGDADVHTELPAEEIYVSACRSTVGVTVPGYAYNIFGQTASNAVTGTGIVLSDEGYVLTNYHVIETAYEKGTDIHILTYEGDDYVAEVIGIEPDSDLAVLKAETECLTAAELGDSDAMRVGQNIYTVGNPLGELTYTMTSGIISALGRRITTDEAVIVNMFQVDAAINNGNSGGPVYNTSGQVIGVVTAKYSQYGMEGLGFAIPINDAVRVSNDLIEKGYVTGKAYLGMSFANVSPSVARYYDLVQGVYISGVEAGSCSEAAGLMRGDIITAIDGTIVFTADELVKAVREYRAGDNAVLTIWREGEQMEVEVVFDEELPAEKQAQSQTDEADQHPSSDPNTVLS